VKGRNPISLAGDKYAEQASIFHPQLPPSLYSLTLVFYILYTLLMSPQYKAVIFDIGKHCVKTADIDDMCI
jgi:hypothetical protein